jgi:WD repeat-containing protein 68
MASLPAQVSGTPKRKEIYKYNAPWTLYSLSWSVRQDKRFRLALGSFVEEYNNKVLSGIELGTVGWNTSEKLLLILTYIDL